MVFDASFMFYPARTTNSISLGWAGWCSVAPGIRCIRLFGKSIRSVAQRQTLDLARLRAGLVDLVERGQARPWRQM